MHLRTAWMLMLGTLLLAGCGCGSVGEAAGPGTTGEVYQAASDDPSLPEGLPRRLELELLPGHCEVADTCNGIVGVNCRSEVDGPFYYVEIITGRILEYCGGACLGGPQGPLCRNCPPIGWTCDPH